MAENRPQNSEPAMRLFLSLAMFGFFGVTQAAEYPTKTLQAQELKVTVYLPDADKGFYRGTRFDWAGVFTLEFEKHKIFGPWKDKHDPTNNDDIVGPCEEFGSGFGGPLNYADAKVGERFLKIGVGQLEKPKEEKYQFYRNYKIVTPGTWTVTSKESEIVFEQAVSTDFGYDYQYTKKLKLDGATLRIEHTLKNTGKKVISSDSYNHNFFNVDGDRVGKNYRLEFPFEPKLAKTADDSNPVAKWSGKSLGFTDALDKGSIYFELAGFDRKKIADAGVVMQHVKSGVTIAVSGDRPPSRFNVWGIASTLCPEPFIQLEIEPGQTAEWSWKYKFSKMK